MIALYLVKELALLLNRVSFDAHFILAHLTGSPALKQWFHGSFDIYYEA